MKEQNRNIILIMLKALSKVDDSKSFANKKEKMETLIIYPQNNDQSEAIKSVLKALKIPYYKSPYYAEYVKKIQESEKHQKGAVILKCEKDISNYFKNPGTDISEKI